MPVSARPGVILLSGSLYFQQVSVRDSGTYVCVVNNSAGEKRMESSLTVTGNLFSFLSVLYLFITFYFFQILIKG